MKAFLLVITFSTTVFGQAICSSFQPVAGRCDLNADPVVQAKCLLRPVKKFGKLGEPLGVLPSPLQELVGQSTSATITIDQVKLFLALKGISEADFGGSLSVALTNPKYFVIHDTSDFLNGSTNFPPNIDEESWLPNNLRRRVWRRVGHVYINRLGQSATAVTFESTAPPSGTKYGSCNSNQRSAFLHIENIQPRIRDRSVRFSNDAIAPTPGFTEPQLERLALVYIVASVRAQKWLIPAFHSPIDHGYPDRHDDPQNFDLNQWTTKLAELIEKIGDVH